MRGGATPFTQRDEVEAEWRIITPIEEAWANLPATDQPRGMPDGNPAIQR
jgi:glucose-6-phosphate 1-dehydrogenase